MAVRFENVPHISIPYLELWPQCCTKLLNTFCAIGVQGVTEMWTMVTVELLMCNKALHEWRMSWCWIKPFLQMLLWKGKLCCWSEEKDPLKWPCSAWLKEVEWPLSRVVGAPRAYRDRCVCVCVWFPFLSQHILIKVHFISHPQQTWKVAVKGL